MLDRPINRKFNIKARLSLIKIDKELIKTIIFRYFVFLIIFLPLFFSVFYKLQQRKIVNKASDTTQSQFAIIFASEVTDDDNGVKLLEDRAKTAAELYKQGKVQRIFISGESPDANINRITLIKNTLTKENVPEFIFLTDDISTRTHETCFRAKTEKGINQAILVTQSYHMPRALYTCSAVGIEVQGVTSDRSIYTNIRNLNLKEKWEIIVAVLDTIIVRRQYQ